MIKLINTFYIVEIDCTLIMITCSSNFNLMNKWVHLCSSLQTIVLCKSKKSDYIDLKTYRLIALLNIMSKALKSIMIKRLSDITETHHMLSNAQMRARCKWFVILTLNLLVN